MVARTAMISIAIIVKVGLELRYFVNEEIEMFISIIV